MSEPADMYEHIKALRALGDYVAQGDVDWLIERTEYLLAEVERLRGLGYVVYDAQSDESPAPTGVEPPLAPPDGTTSPSGVVLARWRDLGHALTARIQAAGWPGGGLIDGIEWLVAERDAALAEVARLRALLDEVETWTHAYGVALTPAAGVADTHGEGVRACKAQIRAILAALRERAGGERE